MKINQPKKTAVMEVIEEAEAIQEKLYRNGYVYHDHGGREHGHDWDDWAKAERESKSDKKKVR